jgi:hypothetical protein
MMGDKGTGRIGERWWDKRAGKKAKAEFVPKHNFPLCLGGRTQKFSFSVTQALARGDKFLSPRGPAGPSRMNMDPNLRGLCRNPCCGFWHRLAAILAAP